MANVENAILKRWIGDDLRPFSEILRDGLVKGREFIAVYDEEIAPLLTDLNDSDVIIDGREAQGIAQLTKKQIVDFMAVAKALDVAIDDTQRAAVRKPTVRPVRVS